MSKMTVIYYVDSKSRSPVKDFIDSLGEKQQDKVIRAIYPIAEFGIGTHLRNTKKLTGTDLWEIRILGQDSIRIIYALQIRDVILILHIFTKKTQKTPPKEIATADRRLQDYISRKNY